MVKRNIIILGISDGHDAGAALIKNGQVMAAVQEERLNNIKHFAGIPEKSILEVFKIAKVDPGEVNLISMVSFDPPGIENLKSFKTKTLIKLSPLLHSDRFIKFYVNYKKKHRTFEPLKKIFEGLGLTNTETTIVEHQTAHAAAAYRSSPWNYTDEGLFLNVKANKLREIEEVDDIFFYPAPDDEGSPVGAALQGYYEYCIREGTNPEHISLAETYYGPSYSNDEIKEILDSNNKDRKWKYDYYGDIDGSAGELLAKGRILARCSGGLELVPEHLAIDQ